ncbi:unnamed protein product [Nezara viridula]|uniref:Gustatory receptor n=1 Tax=Nezara viridula TaxID=85310 RepID=A0A9P0HAV1_NEZVI|nr:unnamed protein product [Nezara viridula]
MDSRSHSESHEIFFQDIFIKIIFLLSRFVGIFPCRYRNGQFFASIPLCIWSFLMACLMTFCTVFFHINLFIPESRVKLLLADTLTQLIVALWFCFCLWVLYMVAVTNSVLRMRHINRILLGLNEVDRQLAILEIRRDWRQKAKYFAKTYFVGLMVAILYPVNSPLISLCRFMKVPLFLPAVSIWLCSAQFTSLADQITLRLDEICLALNDIVLTRHFSISDKKLVTLSHAQDKLCDICIILDGSYAWIITCIISACFNGVFIPLYLVLTAVCQKGLNANLIGSTICWSTISLHTVWHIVSTTSGISMKLRGFNLTLYKLMMSDKRNEVLQNSKLRLHISMQREVVFTAKGFFKLDYTLIQWMLASAATYLVILIQFTSPDEESAIDILKLDVNTTIPFDYE